MVKKIYACMYVYVYVYIRTDTQRYIKKKVNIMKKVNIFCHSFQKVKPIYYIDLLHRVKYFKPLFLEILIIMAYRMKTQNSVSLKIRILQGQLKKSIF